PGGVAGRFEEAGQGVGLHGGADDVGGRGAGGEVRRHAEGVAFTGGGGPWGDGDRGVGRVELHPGERADVERRGGGDESEGGGGQRRGRAQLDHDADGFGHGSPRGRAGLGFRWG